MSWRYKGPPLGPPREAPPPSQGRGKAAAWIIIAIVLAAALALSDWFVQLGERIAELL